MYTLGLFLLLLLVALGIAVLCWVWMQSSRASQARTEELNRRVVSLLEEQNALLREMVQRSGGKQ